MHSKTGDSGTVGVKIPGVLMRKWCQQFILKKPGGGGVKLFQAIKAVNRDTGAGT